ncbi:MAG TPA: zinc-dependent peptidase [Chromatiaceae bacterium]|nr:zinc-dependent peptidase [Chromatiaceae bacterium]
MLSRLRRYRTLQTLRHHGLPDHLWRKLRKNLYLLRTLGNREAVELRKLTTLLLHEKAIHGVRGLEMTLEMRAVIASQACLMILELDFGSFKGWKELIVYPGAFKVKRTVTDEYGIAHEQASALSGESWQDGPLILSWDDVERDSYKRHPGSHVIIHEFAHKLDALNGRVNGMPPLHPAMPIEKWSETLGAAYEHLQQQLLRGGQSINPYAATSPAEFFAVLSEYFFTAPAILKRYCDEVYKQLAAYYRQDPLSRTAP